LICSGVGGDVNRPNANIFVVGTKGNGRFGCSLFPGAISRFWLMMRLQSFEVAILVDALGIQRTVSGVAPRCTVAYRDIDSDQSDRMQKLGITLNLEP